jgi:hypothetical protein
LDKEGQGVSLKLDKNFVLLVLGRRRVVGSVGHVELEKTEIKFAIGVSQIR